MTTDVSTRNNFDITDTGLMQKLDHFAGMMAGGKTTIPKHLQGNKSDCLAIAMQASRWGMDPYVVSAQTFFVNGSMAYGAQLVNAVVTSSREIEGRFHYEYSEGPWIVNNKKHADVNDRVRVGAILKGESEITWGEWLYPASVAVKNSPLWGQSGAGVKQQAAYLAVKYWARMYCPQVILGVYTPDEMPEERELKDITPEGGSAIRKPASKQADAEVIQADAETVTNQPENQVNTEDAMNAIDQLVEEMHTAIGSANTLEELDKAVARAPEIPESHPERAGLQEYYLKVKKHMTEQAEAE